MYTATVWYIDLTETRWELAELNDRSMLNNEILKKKQEITRKITILAQIENEDFGIYLEVPGKGVHL